MRVRVSRRSRKRARERLLDAVLFYAARGWPACLGARPVTGGSRACSCDRVGCPAPGAHPVSPSWALRATADAPTLRHRWEESPDANVVLPTGRVFDVFDSPAEAGVIALARMNRAGVTPGPVAACGPDRYLFFVATRGSPQDEDEWWHSDLDVTKYHTGELGTFHVDSHPETLPGSELRWHCRNSYVLAPPSILPAGHEVSWIRAPGPGPEPLPDPLALLEHLADTPSVGQHRQRD